VCVSISQVKRVHYFLRRLSIGFFLSMTSSAPANPTFVSLGNHTGTYPMKVSPPKKFNEGTTYAQKFDC
jgi:hypothetical protein